MIEIVTLRGVCHNKVVIVLVLCRGKNILLSLGYEGHVVFEMAFVTEFTEARKVIVPAWCTPISFW